MSSKIDFWYDVKIVSATHASVTASIAGLALTLLLIVPVLGGVDLESFNNIFVSTSFLFFLFSMVFGIFASFVYSVVAGDTREERERIISFLGPSVSFGVSVSTLFLGFLYLLVAYHPRQTFIIGIVRKVNILVLWSTGFFVSRTIKEALDLVGGKFPARTDRSGKYKRSNALLWATIFGIPAVVAFFRDGVQIESPWINVYFYYLLFLAALCVWHYAYFSYGSFLSEGIIGPKRVIRFSRMLQYSYVVFVCWLLLRFV